MANKPARKNPYLASMSVNHEILALSCSIAYKLGRLSCLGTLEPNPSFLSEEIKYTLLLEGISLSPSELRGLTRGEALDGHKEAKPLRSLYAKLTRQSKLTSSSIKDFEAAYFPDGAPYRMTPNAEGISYPLPPHSRVPNLLKGLFKYLNGSSMSPITLACLFYFEILAIAPYSKGNGVLARYLFKALLAQGGRSMAALPIEKSLYFQKEKLEAAFAKTVEEGDTCYFVSALLSLIDSTMDGLLREATKEVDAPSPLVDRLLSKMASGTYYSAAELCALIGLKSRLGLQKNYLKPALKAKKILMSNPLCPTDRNQRYCKRS